MSEDRSASVYLMAGGYRRAGTNPEAALRAILADIGVDRPCVAYVGAANGDDPGFFRWASGSLAAAGAGRVRLAPTARGNADPRQRDRVVVGADVVFVSGGDVSEGMDTIRSAGMEGILRERFRGGAPLIGVSAGSILLGQAWIRWRDPGDDATAEVFPCLGIAPLVCDTHEERDDWSELRALLARRQAPAEGFGIPTGAVLQVCPSGELRSWNTSVRRFIRQGGSVREAEDVPMCRNC
jgi:peptidase E